MTVVGLAIMLGGLVAACGTPDGPTAVLKAEFANPTPTTALVDPRTRVEEADACRDAQSLNELGFLSLPDDCMDRDDSTPETFASMADFVGQPEAEELATVIRDRLVMQTGCLPLDERAMRGSLVDRLLLSLPDAAISDAARTAFVSATEADRHCNKDQAAWTAASVRAANAFLDVGDLMNPRDVSIERLSEDCCVDDVTPVTSLLAMASDEIYGILHARPDMQAGEFWDAATHLSHVRTMEDYAEDETKAISTIALGSSVVARGFEATKLKDAFNLGMASSHQPHAVYMADSAFRLHPTIDTIVWGQQSSEMFTCIDLIRQRQGELLDRRSAAFAPLEWAAGIPADTLLLGSGAAAPRYMGTTLDGSAFASYGAHERGDLPPPGEGQVAAAIERRLDGAVEWWANKQPCQERTDITLNAATEWIESGRRVILVFWPLSDAIRELHPEGPALHEQILADVRAQAEDRGLEVLDLSELLADEDFADLTHLDRSGRDDVTAALASYLADEAP